MAGPSGWALATAGMDRAAEPVGPRGPLRKEEMASWWARLGGWILDGLILGFLVGMISAVAALLAWLVAPDALEELWDDFLYGDTSSYGYPNDSGATVLLFLVGGALVAVAWEVFWVSGKSMAKPGQSVAGYRVIAVDGLDRVTRKRAVGRAVAKFIYNIPNLGWLGTIASAFTIGLSQKRQGLHDMMAGTVCVKKDALRARGIGPDADGHVVGAPTYAAPPAPAPGTPPPGTPAPGSHPQGNGPFV